MNQAIPGLEDLLNNMLTQADNQALLRAEQTTFASSELFLHVINGLIESGALPETSFGDFAIALRGKALSIVIPDQEQIKDSLNALADRLQACEDDRASRR